jgi:hypothetical protein
MLRESLMAFTDERTATGSVVMALTSTSMGVEPLVLGLRPLMEEEELEGFKKRGICFKCRKPGHITRECPESSNSRRQ